MSFTAPLILVGWLEIWWSSWVEGERMSSIDSDDRCLDFSLHRGQTTRPLGERTVALPVITRGGVDVSVRKGEMLVAGERRMIGVVLAIVVAAVVAVAVAVAVVVAAAAVVVAAAAGTLKTSPVCSSTCSSAPTSTGARRMLDGMIANDDVVVFAGGGGGGGITIVHGGGGEIISD
jgi:hypothetical protein